MDGTQQTLAGEVPVGAWLGAAPTGQSMARIRQPDGVLLLRSCHLKFRDSLVVMDSRFRGVALRERFLKPQA